MSDWHWEISLLSFFFFTLDSENEDDNKKDDPDYIPGKLSVFIFKSVSMQSSFLTFRLGRDQFCNVCKSSFILYFDFADIIDFSISKQIKKYKLLNDQQKR